MRRTKTFFKKILSIISIIIIINLGIVAYQTYFIEGISVLGASMLPTVNSEGSSAYYLKNFYSLKRGDLVIAFILNEDTDEDNPASVKNKPITYFNNFIKYANNNYNKVRAFFNEDYTPPENTTNDTGAYKCVIKRVIGLPGDTIEINDGLLYINGELYVESYIFEDMVSQGDNADNPNYGVTNGIWILDDDEYYIMGDNRNISIDSNDYGAILSNQIYGKVLYIKQNGNFISVK